MATYNAKRKTKGDTENLSGHNAYSMADRDKLVTQVLTSFVSESKFYGDNTTELIETAERVVKECPGFVARLAVYARRELHMRTVSHLLAAVFCRHGDYSAVELGKRGYARRAVEALVERGDDVTGMMAASYGLYGKHIPNAMHRGLRDALEGLSAYSVAKYQGVGSTVTMADAIKLLRPNPNSYELCKAYEKCIENRLSVPESWRSDKSWDALMAEGKLPYMAALRNLRSMLGDKDCSDETIAQVCNMLRDPERVAKAKQLPFRYLSAYDAVMESPRCSTMITDALEDAFECSVRNLPRLEGRTMVCIDCSSSMQHSVSQKTRVQCIEIAKQLGYVVAAMSDDAIIVSFAGTLHKELFSKRSGILQQVTALKHRGGGCTDMALPFDYCREFHIDVDRFVILSDNEVNRGHSSAPVQLNAEKYRSAMGKDVWVHAIDLMGYGTQQFAGSRTNVLAGWSEKILEFIPLVENAGSGLIERIEAVEI